MQKLYDFLVIDEWLDVTLGVGLWVSSFFLFSLTFIVSMYMFVKAFMLLLSNYLKGKMASSARVVITSPDDSMNISRLTAFAYSTLVTFLLLALINIPLIGSLLTMFPYVKTLIFTLVVVSGSPIKPFLNIVGTFIQPKSNLFLSIMNFSIAESLVYIAKPEHYNDLVFQAATLDFNIFSKVGSDVLGIAFDNLLVSSFYVSQSDEIKTQIIGLRTKLIDLSNLPKLISQFDQIKEVLNNLALISGSSLTDEQKLTLLKSCVNTLTQIVG